MKITVRCTLFFLCLHLLLSSYNLVEWSPNPSTISTPGITASEQQIAMDGSGNVIGVWVEGGVVKSNTLPFGGAWGKTIDVLSQSGATQPQVVLDPNGNATAVWVENSFLKASTKPLGGSWSLTPVVLSGLGASDPCLGVDRNGDVVAAWSEGGVIKSATQMFGRSWQSTIDTLSASGASQPALAVGVGGEVVVVWEQLVSSVSAIFATSKTINGPWSAPQAISTNGGQNGYPCVAVDSDGNGLAAWYTYAVNGNFFSNVYVEAAYLSANGSWGAPVSFLEGGMKDPASLLVQVCFDGNGVGFLSWLNSTDGSTFTLNTSTLPSNGNWTSLNPVVMGNPFTYSFDSSAFVSLGALVWMGYNPATDLIALVSSGRSIGTSRSSWSYPSYVAPDGFIGFPVMVANRIGNQLYAASLWLSDDGSNNSVQANTCNVDVILPPSNLAITNQAVDFGVVVEYNNNITWTPSPSANTTRYRLYRNDFFIAEVDAATFQFTDTNQSPGLMSQYSLYACNDLGDQSSGVFVVGP